MSADILTDQSGYVNKDPIPSKLPKELLLDVVPTSDFKNRLLRGAKRLEQLRAESAFMVLQKVKATPRISSLVEGGAHAEDIGEFFLGLQAETSPISYDWVRKNGMSGSRVIARFHFHPVYSGFSQTDMENREDAMEEKDAPIHHDTESISGVFMPSYEGRKTKKVTLLAYFGRPESTFYQGQDFDRLGVNQQVEALKTSGFNIILADIPIEGDQVDTSILEQILRQVNPTPGDIVQ